MRSHHRRSQICCLAVLVMACVSNQLSLAADSPAPLTAEQRTAIESRLHELSDQLTALKPQPAAERAAFDPWATADMYRKGVEWALRYDQAFTPADIQLINRSLDRGLARAVELKSGKADESSQSGKKRARGYVSIVDGSTQPFGLLVPASYDGQKPIRLDVVLHGSTKPVGLSELRFIDRFNGDAPAAEYIELHPLGRVENCYRWAGETDVFEAIEAVCRNYKIDRDRIVLRGMSMGASGTWHLGLKHPDYFVALGPYCGYVDTHKFSLTPLGNFIKVPELSAQQEQGLHMLDSLDYAPNAAVVPAIAAMGEKDIFFDAHVLMKAVLDKAGLPMVNIISPGTGHVIDPVTHAEQMRQIGQYVAKGLNHATPHVRFVTWTLKYSRCHWLQVLGLDQHYQRAEFDGTLEADGSVNVSKADNISRFAIDPSPLPQRPKSVKIAGQTVMLAGTGKICLVKEDGQWRQVGEDDPVLKTGKKPGLQGPIDDAFCRKFVCVRGTGKPWNAQVQSWADARLDAFADEWRHYMRGELVIKRDVDVTPDDIQYSHLILFGDPGSNSLIAKVLPKLPVTWTEDKVQLGKLNVSAVDHLPALIHPNPLNPGKYVVLNTGHTFREAEFAAVNYLLFPRQGDWAIFKADPAATRKTDAKVFNDPHVVGTGYFNEQWLP